MKSLRSLVLVVAILLMLGSRHTALADTVPPSPPTGTSLEPGISITMVRMIWQDVVMTVSDDAAQVEAVFRFQNQGTEKETFDVHFPLCKNVPSCEQYGPISDFSVRVDSVTTEIKVIEEAASTGIGSIPWATWSVVFPPSAVVEISARYSVPVFRSKGISALAHYSYILETGTRWHDTIREGTVTIRLPYTANADTVCISADCARDTLPSGYTISGGDVIWRFKDLEPTQTDNIEITVLDPSLYRSLLTARSQALTNPNDLNAHVKLARLIAAAVKVECPGQYHYGCSVALGPTTSLISEALFVYQTALKLAPGDANLHAEYLEFLMASTPAPYTREMVNDLVSRLEYALSVEPGNERLLKIRSLLVESGVWPTITPSPIVSPTLAQGAEPTLLPVSTATPLPTQGQPTSVVEAPATEPSPAMTPVPTLAVSMLGKEIPFKWILLPVLGLVFVAALAGLIAFIREHG